MIHGEKVVRCPRRLMLDDPQFVDDLFWLYRNYKEGMLPEGTAFHSNPHKLIQCIRVMDNAVAESKAERDERAARKAAKKTYSG